VNAGKEGGLAKGASFPLRFGIESAKNETAIEFPMPMFISSFRRQNQALVKGKQEGKFRGEGLKRRTARKAGLNDALPRH
jgi:hypothetical protein